MTIYPSAHARTMEEARRRSHKVNFVEDASYAKAINNMSESDTHKFMLALYGAKGLAKITNFSSVMQDLNAF